MMNEATSQSQVPDFNAVKEMWATIDFPLICEPFPFIEKYALELRALYSNGEVRHQAFRIPEHSTFDWYLFRKIVHESGFFEKFWKCKTLREAFPDSLKDFNFYSQQTFEISSPFNLGGSLGWTLACGGAYDGFKREGALAKRLGEEAAFEMLGSNYDDSAVYVSFAPWSEFFHNVAWDYTWIVINRRLSAIHVLVATDTD